HVSARTRGLGLRRGREATHGGVCRQRSGRLGFSLIEKEVPKVAERVRLRGDPGRSDVEKIRARRRDVRDADIDQFFTSIDARVADESVDQLTRDTLRWYIHEERDSRALLRSVYERMAGPPAD